MRPRRIKIAQEHSDHDDAPGVGYHRSGTGHRVRSVLRHPLTILGIVVVTGYAVAAIALNVLVDAEALRGWLAPRASDVLNRPVSVGSARVALLPRPSIHVADVRVDNLADFDGPALAFVERVRFDLRWMPMLIGRVAVDRVRVDGARVYLAIDEGNTSNFGDLLPGPGQPVEAPGAPISLGVERIEVSDASVSYFDAPTARSFTISGAHADATLTPDGAAGWRAVVSADSDSLLLRVASLTDEILRLEGPAATLTAVGDGTGRSVDLQDGTLELSGETLGVSGRLWGLAGSQPSYDLQLTNDSLDAGAVAAAFPQGTRSTLMPALEGELGVTLQLTAARSPGRPPLLRGSVHLSDVSLRMSGNTVVQKLDGTVGVTPDSLVLDSLTGTFAEGPFELAGTVVRDNRVVALVARAEPDLDALDRLGLVPEGTTLSGDATFDLSLAGTLASADSLQVTGTVVLSGVQAKHARIEAPLYLPAGELTLLGREVSWAELPVLLGEDAFVTTGRIGNVAFLPGDAEGRRPHIDASVRGARLDLGAIFPLEDGRPDVTYGQVAFAHLGARPVAGRAASTLASDLGLSRPQELPLRGTVSLELDSLDYRRYHPRSVSARIEMTDSALVVDAPTFEIWGGSATASLELAVGELPGEPFSLALTADDVSAADFFDALTPVREAISGSLSLELEASGALDADLLPAGPDLSGRVSLVILDGRVRGTGPNLVIADFLGSDEWTDMAFTTWESEIELVEQRLEVVSSRLTGDGAHVTLSGLVHLEGSHDLSVGVSIPPDRLQSVSLRRTGIGQTVLDHLAAAGSSLDLGLRMSGELRDPVLEPDASNAVTSIR